MVVCSQLICLRRCPHNDPRLEDGCRISYPAVHILKCLDIMILGACDHIQDPVIVYISQVDCVIINIISEIMVPQVPQGAVIGL